MVSTVGQNYIGKTLNSGKDSNKRHNNVLILPLGVVAGAASSRLLLEAFKFTNKQYQESLLKSNFSSLEQEIFIDEADRMVKESGILAKGFRGIEIPGRNTLEKIPKTPLSFTKKLEQVFYRIAVPLDKFSKMLLGVFGNTAKDNSYKKAFFSTSKNMVSSEFPEALLHEVGHALDYNKNFITKMLIIIAPISMHVLIPVVIINAMLTKKQNESKKDNKEGNIINRVRNFTHNHIGLTVTTLVVPTLLKEFTASFRAVKFANKSNKMTEIMKQKHTKSLMLAFSTYLIGGALRVLTAEVAVRVKDKIWSYQLKKESQP